MLQGMANFFMDDTVSAYLSLIHISKPDTGALSPTIEKSRMKILTPFRDQISNFSSLRPWLLSIFLNCNIASLTPQFFSDFSRAILKDWSPGRDKYQFLTTSLPFFRTIISGFKLAANIFVNIVSNVPLDPCALVYGPGIPWVLRWEGSGE